MGFSEIAYTLFSSIVELVSFSCSSIELYYRSIFVSNPLLLLFVVTIFVGLGIGLIRRIVN